MSKALTAYVETLSPQQARAEEEAVEARELLVLIHDYSISTEDAYKECAAIVKEMKGKRKFLDDERKVTVTPLNKEVDRINDWYRPALDALKSATEHGLKIMGEYILKKKKEEARLLEEARVAALAVKSNDPDAKQALQESKQLVKEAANALPAKVSGVSNRMVWVFTVTDASKLERKFLMPDMKAIQEWVEKHGDKDVPAGVEVREDVRFRTTNRA